MKPLDDCLLYAFVDASFLHGRAPEAIARQLCDGGADLIQLRAKDSAPDAVRQMAQAILPVTRQAEVALVINDYPGIANEVGAEYCHLGQEDFLAAGYSHARDVSAGEGFRVGLSTHSPEEARRALAAGAEYLGVGPVFATGTKPTARPVTLEYVRWAATNLTIPWFAIGGINLDNLDQVLAAGARRICVVSAILNAPDIAQASREFKKRLLPRGA